MTRHKRNNRSTLIVPICLAALMMAFGQFSCLEEQWESAENDHDEEECDAADDETYRCDDDVIELCRMGYWRPWEDCANIEDGTCEVDEASGEPYCDAPEPDTDTEADGD